MVGGGDLEPCLLGDKRRWGEVERGLFFGGVNCFLQRFFWVLL